MNRIFTWGKPQTGSPLQITLLSPLAKGKGPVYA